jgi:hypothetical protein
MASTGMIRTAQPPTADEAIKRIEEVAYYKWLDRGRYAQPGDELNDWIEAEKEFHDSLPAPRPIPKLLPSGINSGKRKH